MTDEPKPDAFESVRSVLDTSHTLDVVTIDLEVARSLMRAYDDQKARADEAERHRDDWADRYERRGERIAELEGKLAQAATKIDKLEERARDTEAVVRAADGCLADATAITLGLMPLVESAPIDVVAELRDKLVESEERSGEAARLALEWWAKYGDDPL